MNNDETNVSEKTKERNGWRKLVEALVILTRENILGWTLADEPAMEARPPYLAVVVFLNPRDPHKINFSVNYWNAEDGEEHVFQMNECDELVDAIEAAWARRARALDRAQQKTIDVPKDSVAPMAEAKGERRFEFGRIPK